MTRWRLILLLCSPLAPLAAQATGGLVGRVSDASTDAPLVGVTVRLDGGRLSARTDPRGE